MRPNDRRTPIPFQEGSPVAQLELGDYLNFVYLLIDWSSRKAAIADPQEDVDSPLALLKENGIELERVFLTHTHFDHVAGVPELIRRFPQLPIHVHAQDQSRLAGARFKGGRFEPLEDGQEIRVGSLPVHALHTPGHSAGELCYRIDADGTWLLTGDTLFIRDCGRTDLDTGSNLQMFESLQRIRRLPPGTTILPGHHYKPECWSTLETELKESPPFQCRDPEELAALP